jgi:hypothetical protein
MRIRIQLLISMRIRIQIQGAKRIRIRMNPDPGRTLKSQKDEFLHERYVKVGNSNRPKNHT